jgi:hypothetical protein
MLKICQLLGLLLVLAFRSNNAARVGAKATKAADCLETDMGMELSAYIGKYFEYVNSLIQRTETRANYLLFSNSVIVVAHLSAVDHLCFKMQRLNGEQPEKVLLAISFVPIVVFLVSVVFSVWSILPKIINFDIAINQKFIAKMSMENYKNFVKGRHPVARFDDFLEECYVLSLILEAKSSLVNKSARMFVFGTLLIIPVLILIYYVR